MRHTVKVLSYLLISSVITSLVFAGDIKTEEELLKNKLIEKNSKTDSELRDPDIMPAQKQALTIHATSKPYSGFLGTVVTPKQKQYPEGAEGAVLGLLDNWDELSFKDAAKAQEKLNSLIREMSYEELKDIYEANPDNFTIENAMYLSWLATQRSGEFGYRVSRTSGTEVEPNDDMSTATAMATDTVSAYITAYDEDWYSFTLSSVGDWVLETHATSADDNVGDTKLYLYAANSSTNSIAYDDDGGTGFYSKISHRFNSVAALPTNLFFSEYAEGSSNNKYLEIYNGTGAAVDLSAYSVSTCSNGCNTNNEWDYPNNITFAAGTVVADGDVYVVHHGSASSAIVAQGDQTFTYLSNGDDVMALTVAGATASTYTIVDIIGDMGDDPGSGWDVAGVTNGTKDHTLVRKSSVRGGNTSWTSSAGTNATDSEWIVHDQNTWTYVGSHTMYNLDQYFIKVAGYSSTTAGAYLLTASSTSLPVAYGKVVINEINYNGPESGTDTTEFIELYNHSNSAVDLSGVKENNAVVFTFPAGASIAAGGYIVLAYDSTKFHNRYGSAPDYEWTSGALSNSGEDIELLDSSGARIDYVDFEDGYSSTEQAAGWNSATDGGGPTYELIDPTSDNSLGTSWRGWGVTGGTPGAANSAQPDISAGSSISGYVAVGASTSGGFQLNNNGDADLTVSAVTVDSMYVPGATLSSEGFETWPPTGWTLSPSSGSGAWAQDSGNDYGPGSVHGGSYSAFFNDYDYSSGTSGTMTSAAVDLSSVSGATLVFYYWDSGGSDVVVVSASTDGSAFTTIYTTASSVSSWTEISVDLASYVGNSAVYIKFSGTSVWGTSNPHIDDFAIQSAGVNIDPTVGGAGVPAWIAVTAPTSSIAAGDSGDVTVTFIADSMTSAASYSATVNVINNDPQDSSYSFTATINALADTAILDVTTAAYIWNPYPAGDSTGSYGTVTIQNDGGSNLVLDSVGYAIGAHWYDDAVDSTVVEANEATTFKVYYYPQASGIHRDTLVVHTNTDSSSAGVVTMTGYAYPDTNYQVEDAYTDISNSWTTSSYTASSSYGWGYFTSASAGYLISTQVAVSAGDELMLKLVNGSSTTDSKYRIYFANSAAATQWSGWTLIDSIEVPAGTSTWDYYVADLGFTTADTGYIGITYSGASYYYVIDDAVIPPDVPEEVAGLVAGYTLESFNSGLPDGWTSMPYNSSWSSASSGGSSGAYVKANVYGTSSSMRKHFTTTAAGPMANGDSLTFAYSSRNWNTTNAHAMTAGDSLLVTYTPSGGSAQLIWSVTDYNSSAWATAKVDLSAHVGTKGIFTFVGRRGSGDWDAGYDEVMYPLPAVPLIEVTSSSLNFYGVAVDTAAGTGGSHSLTATVSNSGPETLTGTIAPRSTDFTVSPATIDLLPDSSMTLTVTYAPAADGFDSSYVDFTTNSAGVAGAKDSVQVLGYAFEADNYDHFEFANYDSSGFVRQNTAGGTYWSNSTSTSALGGSNSVMVSSHKYGGESWLITSAYTIDADGERLWWHMKTNDATPTTTSKLYIELLTGNTLADLANAVTLDSFVVSATASDVTEDWVLNFTDAYNLTGTTYHYGFHYVDASSGGSSATGAGFYIDNIYFSDAPNVPILNLSSTVLHSGVTYLDSGFVRTAVAIGQNTGGDTLIISSVTSDDSDMTVSVVADTILPQGTIALNFSVPDSVLVMGKYTATLTLVHNDTSFSDGSDTYNIKADFTHTLESFESYGVPAGWKTVDADGDGNGWTFGSSVMSTNGSRAAYSYKATDQPSSENWLISPLYSVGDSTDKLIFNAHYSSTVDPDFMHVKISKDFGDWVELANVSMMGTVNWERYEYALSAYVGSDVRFAIVDHNYGNEIMDRLWVDRFLLPAKTEIKPIRHYRAMDANGSYVWDDSLALVQGVVTVSDQYGGPAYIQDDSAGIAVFANDFSNGVNVGDRVTVRGELTVYRGLLEISSTSMSFFVHDTGNVVTPKEMSLETLQDSSVAEAHEGMLLHMHWLTWADTSSLGLDSNWASGSYGFTIKAAQGQGNTFDVRVDNSTDINQLADAPDGIFDMVAVMGQYHATDPYGGFQLLPRSVDDIALYAEYHGTVSNVATGSALSGVMVTSDLSSDTTGVNGGYITASSLEGASLSFSKNGYTPATFSINASGAGFTMMDVGLYPSPDSVVYVNGLEAASDSGSVDTSAAAAGTQWAVVRSLQAEMYVSFNNYLDTLIFPASGSKMLALNDLDTTNGDTGYVNNSYSIWFAPGVVNLAAFTGVTQKTLSMDLWLDTESGWDYVKAMVKSAADTTDTWMILGSNSGNMGGWGSWDVDLAPVDTMTDAQFALLFDSDGSIIRGFGALVDNIQVHGRDLFVAMGPSNLSASNFEDNAVNLSWSDPGTGGSVGYQFIDIYDVLETPSSPVEDPRFNTNPEPYFKTVEIAPSDMNMASSRSLTHYNVFRKAEGSTSFTLYDSASASTSYADAGVTNYMQYHYYVTAVYNEGESGSSNTAMGVPGMVVETVLPLHEDFHAMSGPLPGDWSSEGADVFDWSTGDAEDASGATFTFPYHGEFVYINNDSSTYANPSSPATLVTPFFRHENVVQAAYLKFETYVLQSYSYGSFDVMVRNSYGPWTTVASLSSTSDGWETIMLDVSDHVVGHNYVQVGFRYQEGYYYYRSGWGIDNVKIGLEPGPDNLMAHGSPGAIQLNWGMALSSVQDPGGSPAGFDENNRPVYLSAPNCEVCEPVDVNRIPEILFGASFDFDEPTQFVEYDAVLDTTTLLSNDLPTNWDKVYTDANSSGSFDAGDPAWVEYSWNPTQLDFDQWIISNSFDASGDTSVVLMFDEYLDDFSDYLYPDAHDTAAAHISYDDGVTWTTVWELADSSWYGPFGPEGYWTRHVIPVDGAGTAQMKVAFSFRGGNSYNIDYFHVDNIFVLDEIPQDQYDVFNVYRDGEMLVEDHEYTSFTDVGVSYGEQHCYRVQPKHLPFPDGDIVVTGLSNIACAAPGNQAPTAPTLLSPADNDTIMINVDANGNYVDQNNNVGVSFSWEGSTDADEHELMYYFVFGGEFEMIPFDLGATALLSFEVPYNVLVPAMASIGETVISGNWAIGVTDSIPIYQPVPFELVVSDERFLVIDAGYALSVDEGLLPEVFALHQNFPNPFNPITTIRYDVPEQSHVLMEIYNVLGQKVAVVVNGIHDPGFHAVRWNGTNLYGNSLSSGMYFYHIQAGDFRSIKKLILVK